MTLAVLVLWGTSVLLLGRLRVRERRRAAWRLAEAEHRASVLAAANATLQESVAQLTQNNLRMAARISGRPQSPSAT